MTKDRTVDALPSSSERPADAVRRLDTTRAEQERPGSSTGRRVAHPVSRTRSHGLREASEQAAARPLAQVA